MSNNHGKSRAKSGDSYRKKPSPKRDHPKTGRTRRAAPEAPKPPFITGDSVPEITSITVQKIIERLDLKLTKERIALLVDHLLLVKELNREINLVSRKNIELVLLNSLWDSLAAVSELTGSEDIDILDLGSGGGFPGIPLAVMMNGARVTLLDSRRAKTIALKRIREELKLENVRVLHDRAEVLPNHEEMCYDVITARAVGALKETCGWAGPLLRHGGRFLAWKGSEGLKEFRDLPKDKWIFRKQITIQPHRNIMVLELKPES